MSSKTSGFIHLLLIPVVLLLIGAFLIFNKNKLSNIVTVGSPVASSITDPTSNWKTYTNLGYKFTFKYPDGWIPSDSGDNTSKVGDMLLVDLRPVNFEGHSIYTDILFNTEGGASINPEMRKEKSMVGNIQVTKYSFINNGGQIVEAYTDFGNNNLPYFAIDTDYSPSDSVLVNQILSTFKFTN